jgi:hypothetical protein
MSTLLYIREEGGELYYVIMISFQISCRNEVPTLVVSNCL